MIDKRILDSFDDEEFRRALVFHPFPIRENLINEISKEADKNNRITDSDEELEK